MIEINNLKKAFYDKHQNLEVLNIASLKFEDAKTYFIKGESGTGKTTLFNIMSGLLKADEGTVIFDETLDICTLNEKERDLFRAERIGYVFQSFNLFKGFSALENLIIPLSFSGIKIAAAKAKEQALESLEKVGLGNFSHQKVEKLSGGQQQRVAIARALINNPSVILADEPTGNLDRKNGESIMSLLINLSKECESTLIVISHDLSLAEKFDIVLDIADFNTSATSV